MSRPEPRAVTRRAVVAATATASLGLASLSAPAAAKPPKGTKPFTTRERATLRNIDGMESTIERIQDRLTGCDTEVCETVHGHSFLRHWATKRARTAAKGRDWATAADEVQTVQGIVEGDIELLEGVEDRGSVGDVLGLERALFNRTVSTLSVMPGDNVT